MITSKRKLHLIPLATAGLGLAVFGAGIGLALTGHELALVPVGTCNLSTILAITGTAAFVSFFLIFLKVARSDKVKLNDRHFVGYPIIWVAIIAAYSIALAAASYGAVHCGIAQLIPTEWGLGASMGLQAVSGFLMGCIVYVICYFIRCAIYGVSRKDVNDERRQTIFDIICAGVLGAAAVVAGPALTTAMGVTANSAESIALEIMIAVSINSLMALCSKAGYILDDHGFLGQD